MSNNVLDTNLKRGEWAPSLVLGRFLAHYHFWSSRGDKSRVYRTTDEIQIIAKKHSICYWLIFHRCYKYSHRNVHF